MRACVLALAICLAAGCASHVPADAGGPFIHRSQATYADGATFDVAPASHEPAVRPQATLDPALPRDPLPKTSNLPTVEGLNLELKALLTILREQPTVDHYLAVGAAYHRLGVLDKADENFEHALQLNSKSWEASDGIARVWRDWGFPQYGLPYAYRAVSFAPKSAAAQNTLGTLLFVLGDPKAAQAHFEKAVTLDASAAWAENNLCYVAFMLGDPDPAIAHCSKALVLAPAMTAAHNNLGLVYAAGGRDELAAEQFALAGHASEAAYNMGMVHMARREYREAVPRFETACHAEPSVPGACAWATEARRLSLLQEPRPSGPATSPGLRPVPPATGRQPSAVSR